MNPETDQPLVSVLMPVYNAAAYLADTITSILNQTYTHFEFLIFNDGSTDDSAAIVRSFDDARIRFFDYTENSGYVKHLNDGLVLVRGTYLARMDADDISLPKRFEEQVDFLQAHPEIGLCSCWTETIGPNYQMAARPVTHQQIRHWLLYGNPIAHPAVMLRGELVRAHQLRYEHAYMPAEDYHLWCRLTQLTQLHILPKVLLRYRVHPTQISARRAELQNQNAATIKLDYLRQLGVQLNPTDEANFRQLVTAPARHALPAPQLRRIRATADAVVAALTAVGLEEPVLRQIVNLYWQQLLENAGRFRPSLVPLFALRSDLSASMRLKLLAKCLVAWQPRVTAS